MRKRQSVITLKLGKIAKESWSAFRSKFFLNVLVVFLAGVIVGGYSLTTKNATIGSTADVVNVGTQAVYDRATGKSNADVLENLINGLQLVSVDTRLASTTAQKYTRGVVSVFVNQITSSGSVGFGVLNGINTLVFQGNVKHSVVIFGLAVLLLLVNIYVRNVILVGKCRYFLEHRRYSDTKMDKLLFIYKHGMTKNVAKVMFIKYIKQLLWNFTLFGGLIKSYEYSMIPYILAEDPTIEWKEAFRISKELTRGEKKRIFAMDLVYFVGFIVSSFTYNLLSVFLFNPLKQCAYAEIYITLRGTKSIADEAINRDDYLYTSAVADGVYNEEHYTLKPLSKRSWINIDYDRNYSVSTMILFFFTFAFVGWCWEVFYKLLNEGIIVNRGMLNGPWLPIYGFGGVIIIMLLKPLRHKPFILFLGAFVACGILEYGTSWAMEMMFDTKWWDYAGYFLNINGRVCLEGLFVFGLAGVGFTYIFAPLLDNLYAHLNKEKRKVIIPVLLTVFAVDFGWSLVHPNTGVGITYTEEEIAAATAVTEPTEVVS
ncbi:MAG: hypothetical protein MJ172_02190 [Clostridia bacterium]|nr:hypothetical protein [Clostridia bacterium]